MGRPKKPLQLLVTKHILFARGRKKNVTITGAMTAYGGLNTLNGTVGNADFTKVLSWDGLGLTSFSYAFLKAKILTQVPSTLPTTVTNLSAMFYSATVFNEPIGSWNTSSVTDMSGMFYIAKSFNQPIGAWNTAAVNDMSGMFSNASVFQSADRDLEYSFCD